MPAELQPETRRVEIDCLSSQSVFDQINQAANGCFPIKVSFWLAGGVLRTRSFRTKAQLTIFRDGLSLGLDLSKLGGCDESAE